MPCPRRKLRFEFLDEVLIDVNRLAAGPYQRAGQWNLAQVATHLATAFELSIDGFNQPSLSLPRAVIGKCLLHIVLITNRIPAGRPLPRIHVPSPDVDLAAALARFRTAVDRFHSTARLHRAVAHLQATTTPLAVHPHFGRMSANNWSAFHLIHCAHHLSFLTPAPQIPQPPNPLSP